MYNNSYNNNMLEQFDIPDKNLQNQNNIFRLNSINSI